MANLLIIDLEATTDNQSPRSVPKDEMETIEIGAVMVDTETLQILSEFQTFVRPIRHPILTPFCTELTGITQSQVDSAPTFPEALQALQAKMLGDCSLWGSWGNFDRDQLWRDCHLHNISYPMPEHRNLKATFSAAQNRKKQYGMAKALRICQIPLEGNHHRALDDARNVARMMPWIKPGL